MIVKVKSTHSRHILITVPHANCTYELKNAIEDFFGDEAEAEFQGESNIAITLESTSKFIGLSDEAIMRHVTVIIKKEREEREKYEAEKKKEYSEMSIDIPTHHNCGVALEIANIIREVVKRAQKWAKEGDYSLAVGSMQDAQDLLEIYEMVNKGLWAKAHNLIRLMDTSVREMLPRDKIAKFAGVDY